MRRYLFTALLALALASCRQWDEDPSTGNEAPSTVEPLASHRQCETDQDCIAISTSCNGCCQRSAVNRKDSLSFETRRVKGCAGYYGSICGCVILPAELRCENSICNLVPLPQQ